MGVREHAARHSVRVDGVNPLCVQLVAQRVWQWDAGVGADVEAAVAAAVQSLLRRERVRNYAAHHVALRSASRDDCDGDGVPEPPHDRDSTL